MLAPGGRLPVSVWRAIEYNPGQVALAKGLLQHVSQEAAARVHLAFSLGDAEELRVLLAGAGFINVTIQS